MIIDVNLHQKTREMYTAHQMSISNKLKFLNTNTI